jgi:hypothetical protein
MNKRGGITRKVMMNTKRSTQRKEVTAVDADVPLLRPTLIRFKLSELRLFQNEADRPRARRLFGLRMGA